MKSSVTYLSVFSHHFSEVNVSTAFSSDAGLLQETLDDLDRELVSQDCIVPFFSEHFPTKNRILVNVDSTVNLGHTLS